MNKYLYLNILYNLLLIIFFFIELIILSSIIYHLFNFSFILVTDF